MLKQYEELAVLEQGDDGAIISIRGQGGPSVLLGAGYLGHLEHILAKAEAELDALRQSHKAPSLRLLCLEVKTLFATYDESCNKYIGSQAPSKSYAAALAELEELRKQLSGY
jgi:hypothetical protein